MTQAQSNVPASLIEQLGTGEDVHGLIGKRVRVKNDVAPGNFLAQLFGILAYHGAEGEVIHVADDGSIFADFGDDENIPQVGAEGRRVVAVGNNEQNGIFQFEVIEA